jgi:anti-sigma28 factor (negative regulator of flagellin synthesis)
MLGWIILVAFCWAARKSEGKKRDRNERRKINQSKNKWHMEEERASEENVEKIKFNIANGID